MTKNIANFVKSYKAETLHRNYNQEENLPLAEISISILNDKFRAILVGFTFGMEFRAFMKINKHNYKLLT